MYAIAYPILALTSLIGGILSIYNLVIIASIVLSFVNPDPFNPIVKIIKQLTDPVYDAIKKKVPTMFGSFDLAPIFVMAIIYFINSGILPIINHYFSKWV